MNVQPLYRVLTILPLVIGLGCSGAGKPVKVQGIVTLDDKPLPNAMVQFYPDGDQGGAPASGITGTDGSFRLTTSNSGDGAVPGSYKITVSLVGSDDKPGIDVSGPGGGVDPSKMMDAMKAAEKNKKTAPKKPSLPVSYSDPKKTTLKQVVPPPDGKVILDLRSTGS